MHDAALQKVLIPPLAGGAIAYDFAGPSGSIQSSNLPGTGLSVRRGDVP